MRYVRTNPASGIGAEDPATCVPPASRPTNLSWVSPRAVFAGGP
ncbi:unannotated protein [freshwater metagenome]|uniref:Unannotated protein n=1 Tax=freshwater metagenome TaxID=449393 RepID=A0A6J7HNA4_9ZZZZ